MIFQGKDLRKYFPLKYAHPNSNKKPLAANIIIQKPEPLRETVNAEFVEYLDKVQRNYLEKEVSESVENKEEYFKDLRLAYDVNAELEIREAAIARLEVEAIRHGVWVGSGDLLTMKMFYVALSLRFVMTVCNIGIRTPGSGLLQLMPNIYFLNDWGPPCNAVHQN